MVKLNALVFILSFAFLSPTFANDKTELYGLEKISFDSWTQSLVQPMMGNRSPDQFRTLIAPQIKSVRNEQELFHLLQKASEQIQISSAADAIKLAEELLQLRQEIRLNDDLLLKNKKDSLFLLQLMAEEILVVGQKRWSNFPQELTLQNELSNYGKQAKLRGFSVQSGDVVLSKSTGFGSSSFIALSMNHPHIFSHSTPAYVDLQNRLLSPEAETEDGVKLRDMKTDYIEGSKTRTYIYRYEGPKAQEVVPQVQKAMSTFIQDMYVRSEGDPFHKPAYKYDYSMTPGSIDERGLFCSSVSLEIYRQAGYTAEENPYPLKNWSPVTKGRKKLMQVLNMNSERVPAPGDVELNKNFHLVGLRLDISKLQQDRIEMAIIDSFMQQLDTHPQMMNELVAQFEQIGNKPLNKEQIKKMTEAHVLPPELSQKLTKLEHIPDNINVKQLAFFAFLNEYLTPQIRSQMQSEIQHLEKSGQILGPQALRELASTKVQIMVEEFRHYLEKLKTVAAIQTAGLCSHAL